MKEFTIRGNCPHLKNSKISTPHGPVTSKAVRDWQRNSSRDWYAQKHEFRELVKRLSRPYFVHFTFVKSRDVLWDFPAPTETILDEMVKWNWINDDNRYEICPVYGKPSIDKDNPRTLIRVLAEPPKYIFL